MNPDPNLIILCEELKSKHDCHTVILYGSRAHGDETPTSDYDLMGIRESSAPVVRDARKWNGFYLDVFIYPESKVLTPDESMLHIRNGVVLFQKDIIGTAFLKKSALKPNAELSTLQTLVQTMNGPRSNLTSGAISIFMLSAIIHYLNG